MGLEVIRFDVYLVTLDPTLGSEIQKTRPCLVVSPDEMNHHIRTVIVAPMTTKGRRLPPRPLPVKGGEGRPSSTGSGPWTKPGSSAVSPPRPQDRDEGPRVLAEPSPRSFFFDNGLLRLRA